MPRTRVSLNAKVHQLGWLKPNNLKLRKLTKTTYLTTAKFQPKISKQPTIIYVVVYSRKIF